MRLHTWGLPASLRAAGLTVVEVPGWQARSHGELPSSPTVVWHHDASPIGDSPGALDWMVSNWNTASAQVWIDRAGVVHLVGSGVAWHAGKVLSGSTQYDNFHSIGIETDHTLFEAWPDAQLHALRLTTAVILDLAGRARTEFSFHRLICSPVGRKSDPAGLELAPERAAVYAIDRDEPASGALRPPGPALPTPAPPVEAPRPTPAPAPPAAPAYPGRMIRYRDRAGNVIKPPMRGDDVEALQVRLNAHMRVLGQRETGVDGIWGKDSDRVLRIFQDVRHVQGRLPRADGIAGPATYATL